MTSLGNFCDHLVPMGGLWEALLGDASHLDDSPRVTSDMVSLGAFTEEVSLSPGVEGSFF